MRNNKASSMGRRLVNLIIGAIAAVYLSAPVYAFTPSDSPLLSAGAITPNVLLLVDNSGSMNNLIRATGFDQSVARSQIYICDGDSTCRFVDPVDMDSENVFYSSFRRGGCSFGYSAFYRGGSTIYCLKLPDPVGNGNTRFSARYISYLIDILPGGTTARDYTTGNIPNDYRINVARSTAASLVAANRNLRMGLATFNSPISGNPGPGGYIARTVADLTATTSTTTTQANANYNTLVTAINNLGAVANTPLAETYYEMTRYFRGIAPFYNSSPNTYTSPIQYRCQKNYGVVITDGLPTYDRTFPTNDPQGGNRLPNWDGNSANDGDNLLGDGEGDTLYLDDIAKFAYDIDLRSGGTDAAGKSWDASDFPKQNMSTYTVGFAAANQMLSDAATYGHGLYYQATDATGLTAALTSALNDINSKSGTGGGVATSTTSLTATSQYFETVYDPADWRGTVNAYSFNTDGTIDRTSPVWSTDNTIRPGSGGSYQSWNTATNAPINLVYGNFSAAQQLQLSSNLPLGVGGNDLVEWSKGTNKTGLKVRSVLLGDIINSPLVFASPAARTASDTTNDRSYSAYMTRKASMNPNLVVNSNDGFVNVISTSGARRYAYMPSNVVPNLRYVADPDYISGLSHKFLVDGQITVADAKLGSVWKTLALGGVGAGGRVYYALQLFDATAGNAIKALWEIRAPTTADTSNALNDLGYAYAEPAVARLSNGTWVALISNGYGSNTGRAALYVIDLNSGAVISKLVTPIVAAGETDNGLSSVQVRVDAQNIVQYAYGGDLKGRMWKFDFTKTAAGTAPTTPLFTAAGGASQPITSQPVIGNYTNGRKIIFFGTGKLNEVADKTSTARQAFYAIMDTDAATTNYTEAMLQQQTITNISGQYVYTSGNDVDYSSKKGWYMPLTYPTAGSGERVIYSPLLLYGRIYFSTAILDTTDPCSSAGSGKVLEVDALYGKALTNYAVFGNAGTSGLLVGSGLAQFGSFMTKTYDAQGNETKTFQLGGIRTDDPNSTGLVEAADEINRRIMWRQRQ